MTNESKILNNGRDTCDNVLKRRNTKRRRGGSGDWYEQIGAISEFTWPSTGRWAWWLRWAY
eukprot:6206723-Pleurochrysis_carterae.AAC.1